MSLTLSKTGWKNTRNGANRNPRYRFRITLEGLMLLVVILLIGFAAWHSGTNLLYLIFAILIAFYLLHGALLWLNLRKVVATESFPEMVTVNQPFDVTVSLTNHRRIGTAYAIKLTHGAQSAKSRPFGSTFFAAVPRGKSEERFYTSALPHRGFHTMSSTYLTTRYPFGFEERTLIMPLDKKILALPPTYPVSSVIANIPFGFGDQESNVRGAGTELYGLREYVPGEHARNVHWRTSARAQKIMIAEYSRDERKQVILYLNNSLDEAAHGAARANFEKAVILTASLTRHMLNAGYEVGLITADGEVPIAQGPSQMLSILRHLAIVDLLAPNGAVPRSDRVLQIAYHDKDQVAPAGANWSVIDSRSWQPPVAHGQGEKN